MEDVLDDLERPAKVALPAVEIARQEEVELAGLGCPRQRRHGIGLPDRPPRVGDRELKAGVDQVVPLDEAVHVLVLARWTVSVELLSPRLPHPARRAETLEVVERSVRSDTPHAAGPLPRRRSLMRSMMAETMLAYV